MASSAVGSLTCAAALFALAAAPCWGAAPFTVPGPGDGYKISPPSDSSQQAPAGWEGRTDSSSMTAVGNTPATMGKTFVTKFTLGNQIRACPQADGTSEGTGDFTFSIDYTDAQARGTSTTHIEVRAHLIYTGTVGDDAWLINPAEAAVDYTYDQTGSFRDASGVIANSPPRHVVQRITIEVGVGRGTMGMPDLGRLRGGDPTGGKYAEAYGTGAAVAYWGGVFWSVAQTRWQQGECAVVAFDPPSRSARPALGTETTVKVEIKTKAGESSRAEIAATPFTNGGTVTPGAGRAEAGAPLKLTFRSPPTRVANAGFKVEATSRAGVAKGEWFATLGTGWSGQISCSRVVKDQGQNRLQKWFFSMTDSITIDVKDDVAIGHVYGEQRDLRERMHGVAQNGKVVLELESSDSSTGSAEGRGPASVTVAVNKAAGTYRVGAGYNGSNEGTRRTISCAKGKCQTSQFAHSVASCLPNVITGAAGNGNELRGSTHEESAGGGYAGKGTTTTTVRWDLARQGTN